MKESIFTKIRTWANDFLWEREESLSKRVKTLVREQREGMWRESGQSLVSLLRERKRVLKRIEFVRNLRRIIQSTGRIRR